MTLIRRSGPAEGQTTSTPPSADNDSSVPRCQRCSRNLSAPLSISREHGPACWRRRSEAAERLALLNCGCSDPWICRCSTASPLSDNQIDGYADAARYIIDSSGCTPMLPVDVLRALYRRGGDDRVLAEQLHAKTAGAVAC